MLKHLAAIALAVAILGPAPPADAQSVPFAGMAVDTVAANITRDLEQLVSSLEGSLSRSAFDIRSHALLVISQLDAVAARQQGMLFDNLDSAQRQFFFNAAKLSKSTTADLRAITADTQQITDTFESAMGRLLGESPRLTRASPTFAVARADASVRVEFRGAFLAHEAPSFTLGGVRCEPAVTIDTRLEFDCPAPAESSRPGGQLVKGALTVHEKSSLWQRLTFRKGDSRVLAAGITFVDNTVGRLSLLASGTVRTTDPVARQQSTSHRNDHCSGDRQVQMTLTPRAGCVVDVTNINVSEHSRSSNSVNNGVRSVTETGFQWHGVARNNGSCGPRLPTGGRAWYDGRGWIHVTAHWTDICPKDSAFDRQPIAERDVTWGSAFAAELPVGTKDVNYALLGGVFGDAVGRALESGLVTVQLAGGQALVKVATLEHWLRAN